MYSKYIKIIRNAKRKDKQINDKYDEEIKNLPLLSKHKKFMDHFNRLRKEQLANNYRKFKKKIIKEKDTRSGRTKRHEKRRKKIKKDGKNIYEKPYGPHIIYMFQNIKL